MNYIYVMAIETNNSDTIIRAFVREIDAQEAFMHWVQLQVDEIEENPLPEYEYDAYKEWALNNLEWMLHHSIQFVGIE